MKGPRLLREHVRVGLCRDRLIVVRRSRGWRGKLSAAAHPVTGDPMEALRDLAQDARVTVTLSSDFVRYCVLPWSAALDRVEDWLDYARQTFASIYGTDAAAGWDVRVDRAPARSPRVASAVDAGLVDSLRSLRCVVSVRPYLMAAFNARRRAIGRQDAWFVLQEPGCLTYALIGNGHWRLVRRRRVGQDWQSSLPHFLDRESAAIGESAPRTAFVFSECVPGGSSGNYRLTDVTLARGADESARQYAMALD